MTLIRKNDDLYISIAWQLAASWTKALRQHINKHSHTNKPGNTEYASISFPYHIELHVFGVASKHKRYIYASWLTIEVEQLNS